MRSMRPERIVSELIIIKRVLKERGRSDTSLIPLKSTYGHHGRCLSRHAAQRREQGRRINRPGRCKVGRVTPAVPNSRRIRDARTERVALFNYYSLSPGMGVEDIVVERIGLLQIRVVEQVGSEQIVIHRKLMI